MEEMINEIHIQQLDYGWEPITDWFPEGSLVYLQELGSDIDGDREILIVRGPFGIAIWERKIIWE
jgi:hypothetical protein